MKKIRLGNDITLTWKISVRSEDGAIQDYDLEGRKLTLYLDGMAGRKKIEDFTVEGNILTWNFLGKIQKTTGAYSLTLIENEGMENMHTVDSCEAFALVSRMQQAGGEPCGCVTAETVELVSVAQFGVPGPEGKSAYEIAVEHGFVGTEEEWLDSMKPDIVQGKGDSEEAVMSQKAVTKAINDAKIEVGKEIEKKQNELTTVQMDAVNSGITAEKVAKMATSNELNAEIEARKNADNLKQDKLKAGRGIAIADDNTINVTIDTSVYKMCPDGLPDSPADGNEDKVHLVPSENTEAGDAYTEYLWIAEQEKWEKMGEVKPKVDLSGYATKEEVSQKANKATTLAGYGIKNAYTKTEINTELNKKLDIETAEDTFATIEEVQKISSFTGIQDIGEFSPLKSYDINDICLHDQMLWICTEPHEGQWDEEDFSLSSLTKILKETMDKRVEKVTISFTSDDEIIWADYSIIVENISSAHTYEYPITEDGTVVFDINKGDMYKVSFPVIESYTQPGDRTFMAENNERELSIIYSHDVVKYERVNIYSAILNFSDVNNNTLIDGMEVTALTPSGDILGTTAFNNGYCYFDIPYKTRYVLSIPELDEYTNDYKTTEYTAGVPSRYVLVTYSIIGLGIFGLDVDGNKYTIEQVSQMSDEEKEIIIAVGYNDKNLQNADRGDGTTGCGFCFKVGEEKAPTTLSWATSNIEFDTDYLPFLTSDAMALPYCAGMNYTTNIIRIGKELEVNTPAASHCVEQTLTIGGITRQGFLPAYGQLRRLALNKNQLNAMYEALGKDAPAITSGFWWTSCQGSATNAVVLSNGSFNSTTKTNTTSVLRVFDL